MSLDQINDSLARLDAVCATMQATLDEPARLAEVDQVLANYTGSALIDQMLSECAARLKVDVCALTILDRKDQIVLASSGWVPEVARKDSYCQYVAATGKPLAVPDVTKRTGVLRRLPRHAPLGAYLGVPLVTHDQQLGSLCSLHMAPRQWTTADRMLMEAYSHQITKIMEDENL